MGGIRITAVQRFRMIWLLTTSLVLVTCRAFGTVIGDLASDAQDVKSINITCYNVIEKLAEHGIHFMSHSDTNDVIVILLKQQRVHVDVKNTSFCQDGPDNVTLVPAARNYSVVEGYELGSITCYAKCYPGCDYVWTNVTSGNVIGSAGNLSLGIASRVFTGEYRCTASNISPDVDRSSQTSVYVEIMYVVVFLETTANPTEGDESLSLLCYAKGEPDTYTFASWIHVAPDLQTQLQEYSGLASDNQSRLIIQDLSYMDSGLYKCSVTNAMADNKTEKLHAVKDINVTVKGKPQIILYDRRVAAAIGHLLQLNVTFYSNDNNVPSVTWYRISKSSLKQIQNGTGSYVYQTSDTEIDVLFYSKVVRQSGYVTTLMVTNVRTLDFSNFSVKINNSVGYAEAKIIVSPEVTGQPLQNEDDSPGAVIGGVTAAVVAVIIAIVVLIYLHVYRKGLCPARKSEREENHPYDDVYESEFQPYQAICRNGGDTNVYETLDSGINSNTTRQTDHIYSNQQTSDSTGPERTSRSIGEANEQTDRKSDFGGSINVYGNLPATNMNYQKDETLHV